MLIDTMLWDISLNKTGQHAHRCEQIGFDGLWTYEASHNPFFPLIEAARATTSIELGTNIAVAFARSPFAMAQAAWDLQEVSGGRFHLGLGTQVRAHVERRFSMPFDHPARRLADYVNCLKAIWSYFQEEATPNYCGEFYQFILSNPAFNPGPITTPRIPIYVAGVNPRMCKVAGEVADGFHVHPMHTVGYLKDVVRPAINEGAKGSGRSVDDLDLFASVFVVTGDTPEEKAQSEKNVRARVAFYASTPNYRTLLSYHGFENLGQELSILVRRGEFDKMEKMIPDSLLSEVAVAADPAEIPIALQNRYSGGLLQRVALYFPLSSDFDVNRWQDFVDKFRTSA